MKIDKKENEEYIDVAARVQEFRSDEKYKGYKIITEEQEFGIWEGDKHFARFRCIIQNEVNEVVSTGHALEVEGVNKFISKLSFYENCETSAIGRALATLGIGSKKSIASEDEVEKAKQEQQTEQIDNTIEQGRELVREASEQTKELDLTFINEVKEGKERTQAALKKIGKGLAGIGLTKSVLMIKFNRYDEDGKWKEQSKFFKCATREEIVDFVNYCNS